MNLSRFKKEDSDLVLYRGKAVIAEMVFDKPRVPRLGKALAYAIHSMFSDDDLEEIFLLNRTGLFFARREAPEGRGRTAAHEMGKTDPLSHRAGEKVAFRSLLEGGNGKNFLRRFQEFSGANLEEYESGFEKPLTNEYARYVKNRRRVPGSTIREIDDRMERART